ncbi:thiopurine S-methyltransferase [Oceanospirillum sanctuarii]|uniref:thiopurine S-methyltransferase n=1 Tax=Oceanospirillum sanctuarii TaxID=1434821 RepID=UPI000A3AA6DE|nr:thiopurine S-methyltransferase [Oceanospirillum sanctuarii]
MDKAFWHQRWEEGRIGFHQDEVHPALPAYWNNLPEKLRVSSGDVGQVEPVAQKAKVVFVPLCGKSNDMVWLAEQGWQVIGVELSELAVKEFFEAQGLNPVHTEVADQLSCYQAGPYQLYCGDFFHLHRQHMIDVTAVYDRASLVALPKAKRHRYAFHLAQMLSPAVEMLLVSLEHQKPSGPPFTVKADEIEWLFGANFEIEQLARLEEDDRQVTDVVYRMMRKGLKSVSGRKRKSPGL